MAMQSARLKSWTTATARLLSIVLAALVAGCGATPEQSFDARSTVTAQGDALVLSNGRLRAVIEPLKRRLTALHWLGGPNLLWVNPQADPRGKADDEYLNLGGDKIWLWPQRQWNDQGDDWPPPGDRLGLQHRVEHDGRVIRTASDPVLGVAIHREFRLLPGDRLLIRTQFRGHEPTADPHGQPWLPWQVTQLPVPDRIFVRLAHADDALAQPEGNDVPLDVLRRDGRLLELSPVTEVLRKSFFDADRLAVLMGQTLVVVTQVEGDSADDAPTRPVRAQVYVDPPINKWRGSAPPYVELEFVGAYNRGGPWAATLGTVITVHEGVKSDADILQKLMQ
jgi:hypothetical protein